MRYIKTFEDLNNLPLIEGDYVKFIKNVNPDDFDDLPIYTVIKIDTWAVKYKYLIMKDEGTYKYNWAARDELLLLPKHEIDANKYNL